MTAQHAPHTPPLWRRVMSLPKTTGYGWLAIGLAAPSLVLIVFFQVSEFLGWTFLRPEVAALGTSDQDPILIAVQLFFGLAGGMVALIALVGGHERSWLVWLALVPMLLFFSFLIWPLTSLLNAAPVVTYSLAVLIWVLIEAVIAFWMRRVNSGESG